MPTVADNEAVTPPDTQDADPIPAEIAALRASHLFDSAWYLQQNPDVAETGNDPLEHFCRWGWSEERAASAWFDTSWYLEQNPDVTAAEVNPLLHYAHWGDAEGRRPAPDFDPNWYRAQHELPPGTPALAHYLLHRQTGTVSPVTWFDIRWYLAENPDVAAAGVDPYEHYLGYGSAEARTPRPDASVIRAAGLFESSFYLVASPDVRESERDPLDHFCTDGWREGRKPNPYFDPAWYARTHLSRLTRPMNPLTHYALWGEAMDLRPVPWFEPGWYRRRHALPSGVSPLAHYLAHRRSQAVSPTSQFDVEFYLSRYGHLVGPNRDPFAHYLRHGSTEDLNPSSDFDAASYRQRFMGRSSRHFSEKLPPERQNPLAHFLARQAG